MDESTTNYALTLGTDADQMSDVNTYLNSNWSKIEAAVAAPVVSSLPVNDFSYTLGSKVYLTTYDSIFVLIASDPSWGNFWRPIQARYSPWVQPASTNIITNYGTLYKENTSDPFQYMISNTGTFRLRGAIDSVSVSGYPDREAGPIPAILKPVPAAIAPMYRYIEIAAIYTPMDGATKPSLAQISVYKDGSIGNTIWNPASVGKSLYFSGVEWVMGYSQGYGPDN